MIVDDTSILPAKPPVLSKYSLNYPTYNKFDMYIRRMTKHLFASITLSGLVIILRELLFVSFLATIMQEKKSVGNLQTWLNMMF